MVSPGELDPGSSEPSGASFFVDIEQIPFLRLLTEPSLPVFAIHARDRVDSHSALVPVGPHFLISYTAPK